MSQIYKIFNKQNISLKYYLLTFHNNFVLLEIDNIKLLNTIIDIINNFWITSSCKIKMNYLDIQRDETFNAKIYSQQINFHYNLEQKV